MSAERPLRRIVPAPFRFLSALLVSLLLLLPAAPARGANPPASPAAGASAEIGYDEYVDLVKRVNGLSEKFAAFEATAMSGEARNRFLHERKAEIEALSPVMARMGDPAVKRHEYLTPQVAEVLAKSVDFYRARTIYAIDPKAYDETPAIGPIKFLHRDSSGVVRPVGGEGDLPEGADAMRKVVRATGSDPEWTSGMTRRRDDAGLSGSTTAVLDEKSDADTWHYDPSRKAVVVSPRAAERRQAEPDAEIRSVLAHEHGHSIMYDLLGGAADDGYDLGPDGIHYVNEVTTRNTAFVEGWAEFLDTVPAAAKDGKLPIEYRMAGSGRVKYEGQASGEYKELHALFSTYEEMVSCEGIVALFLKKVAGLREGNEKRMFDALRASKATTLEPFVKRFAADQPDQAVELALLFDEATHRKAPRAALVPLFGEELVRTLPRFLLVDVKRADDDPWRRTVVARGDTRSVELDTTGAWTETVLGAAGEDGLRGVATRTGTLDLNSWRPLDPESLLRDTEPPPAPAPAPGKPAAAKPAKPPVRKPAKPAAGTSVTDVNAKLKKSAIEPAR